MSSVEIMASLVADLAVSQRANQADVFGTLSYHTMGGSVRLSGALPNCEEIRKTKRSVEMRNSRIDRITAT